MIEYVNYEHVCPQDYVLLLEQKGFIVSNELHTLLIERLKNDKKVNA
jgi:hypothetical protein